MEKEEPLEIFQAINDHFKKTILGAPLDVIVGLEIKSFTKIVSAEINEDGNYIKKQTSDIVFQYDYTKNIVILKSENEIEPDTTIMIEGNGLSIDDYELFDKRSIPDEFKDSFSPIDEEDIYRHVRSELKII